MIIGANLDEGLLDTVNLLLNPALYDQLRRGWAVAGPVMLFGKRWVECMNKHLCKYLDSESEVLSKYLDKSKLRAAIRT